MGYRYVCKFCKAPIRQTQIMYQEIVECPDGRYRHTNKEECRKSLRKSIVDVEGRLTKAKHVVEREIALLNRLEQQILAINEEIKVKKG